MKNLRIYSPYNLVVSVKSGNVLVLTDFEVCNNANYVGNPNQIDGVINVIPFWNHIGFDGVNTIEYKGAIPEDRTDCVKYTEPKNYIASPSHTYLNGKLEVAPPFWTWCAEKKGQVVIKAPSGLTPEDCINWISKLINN